MNNQKENLKALTMHFRPSDIEMGQKLQALTGVSYRTHFRSAVAQYMAAHAHLLNESNPHGFTLVTK